MSLKIRKIRCLDGLYYSFELLKHHYDGLYFSCCEIVNDDSKIIPALNYAWGFVDTVHRIREIAKSVPGVNSRCVQMRKFLDDTDVAKEYRHYIQHLNNELAEISAKTFPVWGSLSWVDNNNNKRFYIAILGAQVTETSYSGCVYDLENKKWVSKVSLCVMRRSFHFDSLYESAIQLKNFILPPLMEEVSKIANSYNKLPILTIDMEQKEWSISQ